MASIIGSFMFYFSLMLRNKKLLLGTLFVVTLALGVGIAQASGALALLPSGVGNYNQFSTVGSATHYQNVDESTCNGLTDYNQTTTVGNRDSYAITLSDVPDGAVITAIAIKPCASRVTTGGSNPVANVFYRWGGANSADQGSYSLTGTTPTDLATTTYNVSLSKSSTSTLEIGAVLTSSTKGIRLSRLAANITYETAPADPTDLVVTSSTVGTSSTASLTWTDNANNETHYYVERATTSPSGPYGFPHTLGVNSISYTDYSVFSGQTYYYRVRADNVAGYSGYSNVASTTVP